jgi:hypothetical protein
MALTLDTLTRFAGGARFPGGGAAAPGLYHYATNDTLAVVAGANYFNSAANYLQKGAVIIVSADLDGTPASSTYVVASISAAGVVAITLSVATAAA